MSTPATKAITLFRVSWLAHAGRSLMLRWIDYRFVSVARLRFSCQGA